MLLSTEAWETTKHIYDAIIQHPFNVELMRGTLDQEKFSYYIEQDSQYLRDFSRCLAIIAVKAEAEHVRTFLRYAENTFIAEQEIVHQFFRKIFEFKETGLLSPATIAYTGHLIRCSLLDSYEVAVAAVLPCFWLYNEVGLFIAQHSTSENKYARWIETYSGEEFSNSVQEIIQIFDKIALSVNKKTRKRMLDVFYQSSLLEWHFWNDSYKKSDINNMTYL